MTERPAGHRVLIVEDDLLLREALVLLLQNAGYLVTEAATAAQAIAACSADPPDVVLLDLGLPDRPGLDVVEELRRDPGVLTPHVIAVTGRAGTEERDRCLRAGCDDYVVKPVSARELIRRIGELLG